MSGNVWEWCSTTWLDDYQECKAQVNNALDSNRYRVLRGEEVDGDAFVVD